MVETECWSKAVHFMVIGKQKDTEGENKGHQTRYSHQGQGPSQIHFTPSFHHLTVTNQIINPSMGLIY
jgi:hypothetical protein